MANSSPRPKEGLSPEVLTAGSYLLWGKDQVRFLPPKSMVPLLVIA